MVHRIIRPYLLLVIIGAFASAGLAGCYYDNEEELYPQPQVCDTTGLFYNPRIKAIIDSRCATSGCHDGNSGLRGLRNYQEVRRIVDNGRLEDRVLIRKDMPPTGPIPPCEQTQLQEWLLRGAPENP